MYDTPDMNDAQRREPARSRIERLTRTATALGAAPEGRQRGPNGSHEDLDAVADELDRLLTERGERPVARARRRQRPVRRTREPARGADLQDVMGALDRLDRQVQGLTGDDAFDDETAGHRAGRYAVDRLNAEDDGSDHYGLDDGQDLDADFPDHEDYEDYEDYGRLPRSRMGGPRQSSGRDASLHIYKDLGRRIDALRKPQEKALAHVRTELGSLRDALGGLAQGTNETVSRQNAELRRLTDMVERLRNDKRSDQAAKEIRKEVADLKSMVGRTNVEGALASLEHGYAHIVQRLDELSRASLDPRVLKGVNLRLSEIEDAFAALPRSEHMVVLEDRVVSIAERMEELLQRKDHGEIEPLRAELREVRGFVERIDIKGLVEGIDDRMKFVSGRLDDLEVLAREQRGLDSRLSAMEDRMPEPETLSRLQGRLEDIAGMMADDRAAQVDEAHLSQVDHRLDDIVHRLDRMEQAEPLPSADAAAFAALESRLDGISSKIDVIEKRAARPVPVLDAAAMRPGAGPDARFLDQIKERLNDLTSRLDQPKDTVTTSDLDQLRAEISAMREGVAAPASTEALEQRISDLADIVSQGGGRQDDKGLELLGAKVAALAEQIETTSATSISMGQFSSVLERIETGLQQSRADMAGIARKAAEEVIAGAPSAAAPEQDAAITSLQRDLKRLLDAADGSEERTRNTFDGVKTVLGSITERLDSLEKAERIGRASASGEEESPAAPRKGLFSPLKVEERPPLFGGRADTAKRAAQGAGASTDGQPAKPERSRDRKADFIAAARRAAQAASAEAAQLERTPPAVGEGEDPGEERGSARVGWLRNVLKRTKSEDTTQETPEDDALDLSGMEQSDGGDEQEDGSPLLAGDRPAPGSARASGGRRRAILYTAAAVVLLIAGLYVSRGALVSSDQGPQVASVPENSQIIDAAPGAVENRPAASVARASELDQLPAPPASIPDDGPVNLAAAPAADPVPEANEVPLAATPTAVQASAPGILQPSGELAFAPPAGVAGSFGDAPSISAGSFTASTPQMARADGSLHSVLPPEALGPMALRSAAAAGNAAAEFLIGVKYTEGDGVAADLTKAAVWYQKAADKGLAPAQYRLASLYEKGRGVEKDLVKAQAWYMQSAEAGNAKAMHNLAVLFAEGAGDQPDYGSAAKWFEQAANFGVKDSLFNLGILYAGGIGVEKDLVASYKWFAIAAEQGDQEAAKRRDDVANMMDQETLANAQLAVERFELKTPPAAANKVILESEWADASSLPVSQAAIKATDHTVMVREAQEKLNYLGFDTGVPDGQMGPRTRSAIRAFQRSLGLAETGLVDTGLMDELKSQAI